MGSLPVIFCRNHSLGSILLRGFLWSPWSHCAIIDGDWVIEASAFHGVRERPLADLLANSTKWELRNFPCANPQAVLTQARSQMGKPYDWAGIFGILTRQRFERVDRWFCSELIAWAFAQAGSPLVRGHLYRITPRDLSILPH